MQPKIDAIDRAKVDAEQKADEERQRAAATAASAQAAEDAKCPRWVTNCLLGHFPDGSEQWTGLQYFNSKSQCEGGTSGMGVPCNPCKCTSR